MCQFENSVRPNTGGNRQRFRPGQEISGFPFAMKKSEEYSRANHSGVPRRGTIWRPLLLAILLTSIVMLNSCKKATEAPSVLFAAPVAYSTGGDGPSCVQAADFNGDGKADLAIANQTSGTIAVLFGNGDGTFQAAVTYPVNANGALPVALAVGDFNGDGKPDVVAVNASNGASQASISVFLNKGDGTFAAASVIATPASGQSIVVGDINTDGAQDLWIGASPQSFVMFGNGNGTFQTAISLATTPSGSGGAMGVAIGDVNNDGHPDLLASNFSQNTVGILLNTGNETFAPVTAIPTAAGPAGLFVADLDHDGNLDFLVANFSFNTGIVRFGAGDGTFARNVPVAAGSGPVSAAAANFSAPGSGDLIFADSMGSGVTFVTGAGDGTFTDTFMFPSSPNVSPKPAYAIGVDFNGDGKPDIAAVNFNENNVVILLNQTP